MILPQNSIAVCMDSPLCQATLVVMLQMDRVLQEVWWEQAPVDRLVRHFLRWSFAESVLAVPAVPVLMLDILFPLDPLLRRREAVVLNVDHSDFSYNSRVCVPSRKFTRNLSALSSNASLIAESF